MEMSEVKLSINTDELKDLLNRLTEASKIARELVEKIESYLDANNVNASI